MKRFYSLEYWQDEGWYVGKLKEVPGIFSQRKTLDELRHNILDAYQLMLESDEDDSPTNWYWESDEPDSILIKVRAMDENYYDHFIRYGSGDDFSSFALGQGSSSRSVGIEGGIGVFCAIATDRVYRVFAP